MAIHKIDGVDGANHFPKKFVTLYAVEIVTKDYWVAIHPTDTVNGLGASVKQADVDDADQSMIFGVATETVAAGKNVRIQVAGKYTNGAFVEGATVVGDALCCSTVDGQATQVDALGYGSAGAIAASVAYTTVGVALAADASGNDDSGVTLATNYAHVMIFDQGLF